MHKNDALSLIILFKFTCEVVSECHVELLANLAFESILEVYVSPYDFLKRDNLMASKYFILKFADKEFGVQICEALIGFN